MKKLNVSAPLFAALAVGAAAVWFAAESRGKDKCENVEVCKYGNVEAANVGRARSPISLPCGGRYCS